MNIPNPIELGNGLCLTGAVQNKDGSFDITLNGCVTIRWVQLCSTKEQLMFPRPPMEKQSDGTYKHYAGFTGHIFKSTLVTAIQRVGINNIINKK